MIIHIVMFKLNTQPPPAEATPPTTFTDATATQLIHATQKQISDYQEQVKREIADALGQVPGPLKPMQFGPPLIPDRAKGYNFALYSHFKDREALHKYAVSDEHVKVVNEIIKPRVQGDTLAYDFEFPDDA